MELADQVFVGTKQIDQQVSKNSIREPKKADRYFTRAHRCPESAGQVSSAAGLSGESLFGGSFAGCMMEIIYKNMFRKTV
jgi:hypothetical protein